MATKKSQPKRPNRFIETGMGFVDFACKTCAHWTGDDRTCKAFPNGIPDAIWTGENDHSKPVDGDGGITYKGK